MHSICERVVPILRQIQNAESKNVSANEGLIGSVSRIEFRRSNAGYKLSLTGH